MMFCVIDKNGKEEYKGIIDNNKRLDIVIGLPSSGKSSAIVDKISKEYHSRVIDNDMVKEKIPELLHELTTAKENVFIAIDSAIKSMSKTQEQDIEIIKFYLPLVTLFANILKIMKGVII